MESQLDPTIRYHLRQHLVNFHHRSEEGVSPLIIGTTEQLSAVVKISSSEIVSECFSRMDGSPRSYPELPKRTYLVACIDGWLNVNVVAIYSLKQMTEIKERERSAAVRRIEWKVLEIPEKLETDLLEYVNVKEGMALTEPDVFFRK